MRSNAGTCINQRPLVRKGDKVKAGDVLADGPCTDKGELALGRNVLVAFMPWNGYNFEDAITISAEVVKEDIYTSIHIEEFEVGARDTKLGPEEITRDIPNVGDEALKNLSPDGVVRIGAEVKPGDILVGKITPKSETELAPEERLLRAIFGEKAADVKDTSLRVPSGCTGIVMDVRVSSRNGNRQGKALRRREQEAAQADRRGVQDQAPGTRSISSPRNSSDILLNEKIPLDVVNGQTGEIIIPANKKITKALLSQARGRPRPHRDRPEPGPQQDLRHHQRLRTEVRRTRTWSAKRALDRIEAGDELEQRHRQGGARSSSPSKRKLSVGDKMAGRHGNKGVVATIVPEEDMPFLEDGTPVDIVLNPLGVPSRMNVGQVLETHLGVAASALGLKIATPVFDGIPEEQIMGYLKDARKVAGFKWIGLNGKSEALRRPHRRDRSTRKSSSATST